MKRFLLAVTLLMLVAPTAFAQTPTKYFVYLFDFLSNKPIGQRFEVSYPQPFSVGQFYKFGVDTYRIHKMLLRE